MRGGSIHRRHLRDFGNLFPQVAFDAHLQGHAAAGAAMARAVKPDVDHAARGDINQLDIAPVGLDGGPHQIERPLNPRPQIRARCGGD